MKQEKGYILLQGGAEFGGQMAVSDRRAIELAGGFQSRIDIIPAAAAPDSNHLRAGENGVKWFNLLGAHQVVNRLLIDNDTAQDPRMADELERSRFIYLLGGFPGHLAATLHSSRCLQSILWAWKKGAVFGGSSAGAMVLAEYFYDPGKQMIRAGLGLLANICIIPHYQKFAAVWTKQIKRSLPGVQLLGIDEETGIINDVEGGGWNIYGRGNVYLIGDETLEFGPGSTISYMQLQPPSPDPQH
jgi:cyanophycinase